MLPWEFQSFESIAEENTTSFAKEYRGEVTATEC